MKRIDTRSSLRIAVLLEMLEDVSRATSPDDAVRAYASRIRRVRPLDAFVAISVKDLGPDEHRLTLQFRSESIDLDRVAQADDDSRIAALPVQSGGFLAQVTRFAEPQLLHELSLKGDPTLGDSLSDMGSCLAVPIFDAGRIEQWWLMFRRGAKAYGPDDLEDDLLIGNLFGAMTQNLASLEQIGALNSKLRRQFEEVASVQQALLPERVPKVPGFGFASSYLTSEQAGGDYYDFFELPGDKLGILLADVSGHGPAAATVMAMFRAILHAIPNITENPAAALTFANARLCETRVNGGYITAILGVLDTKTRSFTLARAGHPMPRVRRADGHVFELPGAQAAMPLGIQDVTFSVQEQTSVLAPGDTIVLFTDGITECFDAQRAMLGVEGLDAAIGAGGASPTEVVKSIEAMVRKHAGSTIRADDQTLVVFGVDA